MNKPSKMPKMILFDYGQTLVNEERFDGVSGTEAVMKYAVENKHNKTPQQVWEYAGEINRQIGRFNPDKIDLFQYEITSTSFNAYLYESLGINLSITYEQAGEIFWDAAAPGKPANGIEHLLEFLKIKGIRTGVISNLSYSGKALAKRINMLIPQNDFEFILSSCDYVFRKPNKRIFELALEKASLKPSEVWFAGDQYKCDVVGALGAELYPLWYTEYLQINAANTVHATELKSWQELENILTETEKDCVL